jgi:hypothetical protein
MSDSDFDDRVVSLREGVIVPTPAYMLLMKIEERGCVVRREGNGLLVQRGAQLTPEDWWSIRRWASQLLKMLDSCSRLDLEGRTDRARAGGPTSCDVPEHDENA